MTTVYYYGPLDAPGHQFFDESGSKVYSNDKKGLPWKEWDIDGKLQPGCSPHPRDGRWEHAGPEIEGEALLHHKDGWTAISFWDRSVDPRGACNSTYIAEGTFTFEQMVELAKTRFAARWSKMKFEVRLSDGKGVAHG